jgi:PAT family beta-lactamase induction signal transducer AmpG
LLLFFKKEGLPSSMPRPKSRLLVLMVCFGFLSGLPLPLTIFTLQQWFTTYGISLHAIGLTAWIGLPYTLKFLWSAAFDRPPPGPLRRLGRRRGWLVIVQPLLAGACAAMAFTNPGQNVTLTIVAALALAFFSASQDILIDAWRIETFAEHQQGVALATYVWGYRGAMLTSGAGAIGLASVAGWRVALLCLAVLLAGGVIASLTAPEPQAAAARPRAPGWRAGVEAAFLSPLREFLGRPAAWQVLAFVLFFRIGKVFADNTAAGLYRYGLGFQSGGVAKANAFEIFGTLSGAVLGGWLVSRFGAMRALLGAGLLLTCSLGLYLALLATGNSQAMLTSKVVLEMFAQGAADTCFLAYISTLCSTQYTATQYAMLSSLAAVALHLFSGFAGYAVEAVGYRLFYVGTMLAGLPALLILWQLHRRGLAPAAEVPPAHGYPAAGGPH